MLAELAAELDMTPDALRSALKNLGSADEALQPTYLTTDAAGLVSADFSGKVHAQGLELDLGTAVDPPDVNSVTWSSPVDGYIGGKINTYEDALNDQLMIEALARTNGRLADIALVATNPAGTADADVHINASSSLGALARVLAEAGAHDANVIDQNGASSFCQLDNCQRFSAVGPAPITWDVNIKSPTAIFIVSGSAYDSVVGKHNGMAIRFANAQRDGFDMFYNVANQHLAFPTRMFIVTGLAPGLYTGANALAIFASGSSMTTDGNDDFRALVLN